MVSKILNAMGTKESKEKIHSDSRENSISRIYYVPYNKSMNCMDQGVHRSLRRASSHYCRRSSFMHGTRVHTKS
jgi:hypothetical protein